MLNGFTDMGLVLLNTVLPERCVVCKREHNTPLCTACLNSFTNCSHSQCLMCQDASPFGMTHRECKRAYTPDRFISVFEYSDPKCAEAIIQAKYKFISGAFQVLGQRMASSLKDSLSILNPETTRITALPLHKRRERWRGFNQSKLLATKIAEELGFACIDTLIRKRYTTPQKDLKKHQRETNILSCFAPIPSTSLTNKTVVLVDDVTTTGSTLKEATKVLKEVGANQVWCVTLAKE